jgi:hypothetical protein
VSRAVVRRFRIVAVRIAVTPQSLLILTKIVAWCHAAAHGVDNGIDPKRP